MPVAFVFDIFCPPTVRNPCAHTCRRRLHPARHQHRRPIHGMEPQDVLPDEMDVGGPHAREPLRVRAVPGRREVVRERVEPDVADVVRVPRQRDPPAEVRPADREVLEASADQRQDLVAAGLGLDGLRMPLVVLQEPVRVGGEPEEVVLLPHALDGPTVDRAHPVHELVLRVVRLARDAVQALVVPDVDVLSPVLVTRPAGAAGPPVRAGARSFGCSRRSRSRAAPTPRAISAPSRRPTRWGSMPAASAARWSFRPCSSVPVRWKTRSPRIRWYRATKSVATALYAWPMCGTSFG